MRVVTAARAAALAVQALLSLAVGVIAVVLALMPVCVGVGARPRGFNDRGISACTTRLGQGVTGVLLLGLAVLAAACAATLITAAVRPRGRAATCALLFQVVAAAAAVFGGARWLTTRGGISPTWLEASAVVLASAIVVALTTGPLRRRSRTVW